MTMNTLEDRIKDLFQNQAARVDVPPPDPRSVLTTRPRSAASESTGWAGSRLVLVGAIALVAAIAGGLGLRWASPGTVTGSADEAASTPDRTFEFDTQVGVRLQAADIVVETGGQTFSPTGDSVTVNGDPGRSATDSEQGYTTLELTWFEHGAEMRINLYFASDETEWWIEEVRTYDGDDPGEWITMTGDYARTPIGQPLVGDFEAGPLQITGMTLEAFVPRLSSCDGSGPAGQPHLELSGPRPVAGSFMPGGVAGYATSVAVLDAATCEPIEPDHIEFKAVVADPEVVALDDAELTFDPPSGSGQLRVGVTFVGIGETTVTVEAVDRQTGSTVTTLDIPVTVTEP